MLAQRIKPLVVTLALIIMIGLAVWGIDRSSMMKWVGATNLNVDFIVVDSASEKPIPDARIHIRCHGAFYDGGWDEDFNKPFELRTDANGRARRLCRNNRCIGTQSLFLFTNTYVVYVPNWDVQVAADGYEATPWTSIYDEHRDKVEHDGPRQDRLTIRIALKPPGGD